MTVVVLTFLKMSLISHLNLAKAVSCEFDIYMSYGRWWVALRLFWPIFYLAVNIVTSKSTLTLMKDCAQLIQTHKIMTMLRYQKLYSFKYLLEVSK